MTPEQESAIAARRLKRAYFVRRPLNLPAGTPPLAVGDRVPDGMLPSPEALAKTGWLCSVDLDTFDILREHFRAELIAEQKKARRSAKAPAEVVE